MEQECIAYTWPDFTLAFNPVTGEVTTFYDQWRYSRVLPDETDAVHAQALGITPNEHKLVHELAHHILALSYGESSSPIVWCAAHCHDMPEGARDEERGVAALVYAAFGTPREEDLPCYISFKEGGVSLEAMVAELQLLLEIARTKGTTRPKVRLC